MQFSNNTEAISNRQPRAALIAAGAVLGAIRGIVGTTLGGKNSVDIMDLDLRLDQLRDFQSIMIESVGEQKLQDKVDQVHETQ